MISSVIAIFCVDDVLQEANEIVLNKMVANIMNFILFLK
jgi:hypothetical protein